MYFFLLKYHLVLNQNVQKIYYVLSLGIHNKSRNTHVKKHTNNDDDNDDDENEDNLLDMDTKKYKKYTILYPIPPKIPRESENERYTYQNMPFYLSLSFSLMLMIMMMTMMA